MNASKLGKPKTWFWRTVVNTLKRFHETFDQSLKGHYWWDRMLHVFEK